MYGYMYSPITQDFICKTDTLLKRNTIPLKFELESCSTHDKKHAVMFPDNHTRTFKITSIGGKRENQDLVSLKKTGEAKIFRGTECKSMKNGVLTHERCAPTQQQIFIWVPEPKLDKFVDIIGGKYQEQKNSYKIKNDLSEIKRTVERIKNTVVEIGKRSGLAEKHPCKKRVRFGSLSPQNTSNDIFRNYMKHICMNSMPHEKCEKYGEKIKMLCLKKHLCTDVGNIADDKMGTIFPSRLMTDIESILSSSAHDLSKIAHHGRRNGRLNPELLGEQLKPAYSARECLCKYECVKNLKNGLCYYRYDMYENLKPLMKGEDCCELYKKTRNCETTDLLDAFLCNLENSTDTSTLSEILRTNSMGD
ncbi:hypothetical protein GINT2_000868 [Glugoides intestinalis]